MRGEAFCRPVFLAHRRDGYVKVICGICESTFTGPEDQEAEVMARAKVCAFGHRHVRRDRRSNG